MNFAKKVSKYVQLYTYIFACIIYAINRYIFKVYVATYAVASMHSLCSSYSSYKHDSYQAYLHAMIILDVEGI